MSENSWRKLVDQESIDRYHYVATKGREIFGESAIVNPLLPLTSADLVLVSQFHREVSPKNPQAPFKLTNVMERGQDPSSFGNWELPGGPLEHMELAAQAALIIVSELKDHLMPVDSVSDQWAREAIEVIKELNPYHVAVAAGLHDEGRQITQMFYTNDRYGGMLLRKIGVRPDIIAVIPDEEVMQVPLGKDMDEYMQAMNPESVLVRIADEFGKRKGGTDTLLQPEDINPEAQRVWGDRYVKRPFSRRPTDRWWRGHIELHNDNAVRYVQGLDQYVRGISTLTLKDLTTKINTQLAPTLPQLQK